MKQWMVRPINKLTLAVGTNVDGIVGFSVGDFVGYNIFKMRDEMSFNMKIPLHF